MLAPFVSGVSRHLSEHALCFTCPLKGGAHKERAARTRTVPRCRSYLKTTAVTQQQDHLYS